MATKKKAPRAGKDVLLVRIVPRKNKHPRSYWAHGILFREQQGWYKVERRIGVYLESVHENSRDPDSPRLFEVYSEAEAVARDERERERQSAKGRATAARPNEGRLSVDRTPGRLSRATPLERAVDVAPEGGDLQHEDLAAGTSRARQPRQRAMRAARPEEM